MTAAVPVSPVLRRSRLALVAALALLVVFAAACDADDLGDDVEDVDVDPDGEADDVDDDAEPITVYSGRSEELVGPLLEQFTDETGIEVDVRYGDTAEMAATILEEGENTPADVYYGQDAGALGALASEGVLAELPADLLDDVEERFRAGDDTWVGTSGRARTLVYSTDNVDEDELPDSILDLTDDEWSGRIGWAPTNGSFQAHVTAMRAELGDEETAEWLEGIMDNEPTEYDGNTPIVEAVDRGEVDVGLVNHYYVYQLMEQDPDVAADNHFFPGGDIGALVNIAGAGILETSDDPEAAEELIAFLLSEQGQTYFSEETFEYPLVEGIPADDRLTPLADIETPELDLGDLEDLEGTLELLDEVGAT